MAFPIIAAASALGGASAGFFAGIEDDIQRQRLNLPDATGFEKRLGQNTQFDFSQLRDLIGAGPGKQDISAALNFNRMVGQHGLVPNQGDIGRAGQFTSDIFAGEREALGQSFEDQLTQSMRQRGLMGRGGADPILQAKLAQEQTRQQRMLGAQETGFSAQFAQGLAQQRGTALNQLASQAQQNRLALLQSGSSLLGAERQFRLAQAEQENIVPGSFAKGMAGLIGGAGKGLSAASSLQSMGGFGGGGGGAGGFGQGGVPFQGNFSGFTPMQSQVASAPMAPMSRQMSSSAMGPGFASSPTFGPFPQAFPSASSVGPFPSGQQFGPPAPVALARFGG